METFGWKKQLVAAFVFVLFSAVSSFAQDYGNVKFGASTVDVHESDVTANIAVVGTGGSLQAGASIFAHSTNSSYPPSSTAILYVDYTTNSTFKIGPGGEGAGIAVLNNLDNNTQYVPITLIDNTNVSSTRTIVLGFWGTSRLVGAPTTCTLRILDDDSLVTLSVPEPLANETGPTPGQFLVTRNGDTSENLTVNFLRSGTAVYTTDYTLTGSGVTSTTVVIPAGTESATISVSPTNDPSPELDKTVTLTLISGYYKTNSYNIGTVTIIDNDPVVSIAATDASASESGDSGMFSITRTSDPSLPLTVYFTAGGTASNGVDYASIPGSVTLPSGESYATVTASPIYDLLSEGTESVTLTLVTNSAYTVGSSNSATVNISDYDDNSRPLPTNSWELSATARTGRFVRGTGTNSTYHSFVIPVELEKGVPLDDNGGNATNLFASIPWSSTLSHYNATNGGRFSFQNPIAAFGSRVGGSPLYFDQPYTFGIYAGDPSPTAYTNANSYTNALRIQVYQQGSMAFVGTVTIPIPNPAWTNDWVAFLTNGYTKTVAAFGLTTTLSFNQPNLTAWDANPNVGPNDVTYHLIQTASQGATNYVYMVELAGGISAGWTVVDGSSVRSWSRLYTLEFKSRPPWRAIVLDRPNFQGLPMPPAYWGKSPDELATNSPPVTNVVSLPNAPSTYTNLDQSPELRRHPILDQFVTNMAKDPLLLANYVLNEVELTDAVDYSDSGALSEIAVNPGGVSRGALGTFLEGQGSPVEQCALLIYLLRQANVPAVYVFPPHNGLQMVDSRLSTLLRMQIRGAVRGDGTQYTTNRFIPVNYPWVAVYIGTNWVHVFPWLKDTEVTEGFELHDYLPAAYNTPYKWARDYIFGSTNLLSLSREDDTPLTLYPKWLQKTLNESAPGMSLADFGIRFRNRPQYRSRWNDFPAPTYVTNSSIAVESLGSWGITNVSPALTNIFDTVSVEVKSLANTNIQVFSGELRLAELNDRRFLIRHEKVDASTHRLMLSLAPYRTNITVVKDFSTVTQVFPPNTNALNYLVSSNTLGSADNTLQVTIVHKWHRSLPSGFSQPDPDTVYLGYSSSLAFTNIRSMAKGDFAAICLNMGRVTKDMLDVHAMDVWQMEQQIAQTPSTTNSLSPDRYQGSLLYLMGMSYFEKNDRFRQFVAPLHKANIVRFHASGLAGLVAKRDANGALPDGDIILIQPKVDMFYKEMAVVDGSTYHLEAGDDSYNQSDRWFELFITAGSAQEHGILNTFFKQSDSISTVKLLRLALSQTTNGIVELNRYNYVTEGNKTYPASSTNKLKDFDVAIWTQITNSFTRTWSSNNVQGFMTPGKIRNLTASYEGVGALIFSPGSYAALISANLNGGYGENMADESFDLGNLGQTKLNRDQNGDLWFQASQPTSSSPSLLPATDLTWNHANNVSDIDSGAVKLDSIQNTELDTFKYLTGLSSNQRDTQYDEMQEDGALASTHKPTFLEEVRDPVNAIAGDFYVDETDLVLPGPMPLQVRRNYSSHNVFGGDLGYGWKLSYFPYLALNQSGTTINCSEIDGSVLTFRQSTNNANLYQAESKDNPRLQNFVGSIANLFNAKITKLTTNSVTTYTHEAPDGSKRVYRVKTFPISTLTRSRPYLESWTDSRGNFLKYFYGSNSLNPDFGKVNRVEANNGNFLNLQYDAYGHVTDAFTGDGRHVNYEYDTFGDLVRVTLPDAAQIEYEYEHRNYVTNTLVDLYSTHLLVREIKPEGRILENQYDAQRRVLQQSATVGYDLRLVRNASFVYSNNFNLTNHWTNFITGYTLITDYRTNVTRYDYTNSLMRRITDPINRLTIQDWYSASDTNAGAYKNSIKSTTDPRGLVTTRLYDVSGNLTNTIIKGDITGNGDTNETAVTSMEYNTNRLVTRIVDPVGNQTTYTYTNTTYPYLRTTEERYASNGTSVSVSIFTYYDITNAPPPGLTNYIGSFGLLRRGVRAFGTSDSATNEWLHDPHGFQIQQIGYSGTSDPNVTNTFFYNLRGELVESTDAAGRATKFTYDGNGRVQSREVNNESAQRVSGDYFYYNENGELTWTDGPRFDPEDYVWRDYDGAGRKVQEIHWRTQAKADGTGVESPSGDELFATSFMEHDAFGNLIKTIDPRGHYQRMTYDAVGQMLEQRFYDAQTGQALATNRFAYEPGGQVTRSTNALGGVVETLYTTTGRPKFQQNPDGSTNAWRYLVDGRAEKEIQGNGAYWQTTYDDANRKTTRIFYSNTATPLATNVAELDRRSNLVKRTDADGNVFTNLFDGLDRLKVSAGPAIISVYEDCGMSGAGCGVYVTNVVKQAVTNYYDISGVATTNINALGEKTITYRDALGRVTRAEIRSSGNALVHESSTAYAQNHHSVTVTNGSGAIAITSTTFTDNDGRTLLSLAYPSSTVREFTRREYDLAGNLDFEERDSSTNAAVTVWNGAAYSHDGLNRMTAKSDRDAALTYFYYDAAGNLTNRMMPGGLQWSATYNNAGQMLKEWNIGTGGAGTRTNTYGYFSAASPFAGLLQTRTNAVGRTCTYTYDDWLRLTNTVHITSDPYALMYTDWGYDARGLLTSITEHLVNNLTGPETKTVLRSYDAYGQLTSESIDLFDDAFSGASQTWDAAGRRTGLNMGIGYNFGWRADGLLASVSTSVGNATYGYDSAGILTNRLVGNRATSIASRDGSGRPLSITTKVNTLTKLTETLARAGDGLLSSHTLERAGDFTDSRSYSYASLSRRLTNEWLNLDGTKRWTNMFTYDGGAASGPGALTKVAQAASLSNSWSGGADAFSRVNTETNTSRRLSAYGRVNGPATMLALLDGQPMPVTLNTNSDAAWTNQWRSVLELTPGAHQLQVSATHPSGLFTTNKTSWFTNNAATETVTNTYGERGILTQRIWKSPDGTTTRLQTIYWDEKERPRMIIERDNEYNGYLWLADYDGLGRRLRTRSYTTINGVTEIENPTGYREIRSYYDPQAEFLELGVNVDGRTTWKVYGPDLSGAYGGMNGVGGLEAVAPGLNIFNPTISDARGNVLGAVTNGAVSWNPSRPTGYGAAPGYRPLPLGHGGDVVQASGWRGVWSDISGLYWRGARYYEPIGGHWMSVDPVWNGRDPNYYTFAGGDPVNYFDADGRMGKAVADTFREAFDFSGPAYLNDQLHMAELQIAQRQWYNGLPPSEQVAYNIPLPVVFNGVQMFNNIASGNLEAAGNNSWNIAGDAINTALTLGLFRGTIETPAPSLAKWPNFYAAADGTVIPANIYRVFGGKARGMGDFWTTVNPATVPRFRDASGLHPGNAGTWVVEGRMTSLQGVMYDATAVPGPTTAAGQAMVPQVQFQPGTASSQVRVNAVYNVRTPY